MLLVNRCSPPSPQPEVRVASAMSTAARSISDRRFIGRPIRKAARDRPQRTPPLGHTPLFCRCRLLRVPPFLIPCVFVLISVRLRDRLEVEAADRHHPGPIELVDRALGGLRRLHPRNVRLAL